MAKYADRVFETTTTSGTGTINLAGAQAGFQGFVAAGLTGGDVAYAIESGNDWEVGLGTVTDASPDTLARDTILASSNGGAAISLSGTSDVFCTFPADLAGPEVLLDDTTEPTVAAGKAAIYNTSGTVYIKQGSTGDTTIISPHDPETGEWVFYCVNRKTGKRQRVWMGRLMKFVAELYMERHGGDSLFEENEI